MRKVPRGFTLTELMIAIVVMGVIVTLAVPSMYDYIRVQRLKSVSAQLVTDFNFARSEAVTRNAVLRIVFDSDGNNTCYVLFTNPPGAGTSQRCDCKLGPGSACSGTSATSSEVRTVVIPRSNGITVSAAGNVATGPAVGFDNITGGLISIPNDSGGTQVSSFTAEVALGTRVLRTVLGGTGRPTVCAVGSNLGASAC